jgi:D-alanyl-lipoteichoic acid acyltransferase DltB (MBOAT superfamily)
MIFNSLQFLFFFPVVVSLYFATPYRFRWILLLGASYYFYMCWKPEYVILIIASTLIDYFAGIQMAKTEAKSKRKKFLILSIISNLGILFSFKYFNFFSDSIRAVFNQFNIFYDIPAFNVLLPIGISFYTFQSMSYSIEVYRGKQKPERHLGIFALYVAFFPQLVAGPIERPGNLLPQFRRTYDFDYQRVTDGLRLMVWGFFKKLVIADSLALTVNQIYNNPTDYSGIPLIVATYFFAFQIYCDFSGYSDIAVGAARVMGFNLMQNFRQPYFSQSISEFWRRWHISLSSWFKDYLYISLGGNRVVKWRWYSNLLVVFLVVGLWHGANWTFVIWGGLHGFYRIFSILTERIRKKLNHFIHIDQYPFIQKMLRIFITFHLVLFAWIFFRANSLSDAIYIITHMFSNIEIKSQYGLACGYAGFAIAILSISFMEIVQLINGQSTFIGFLRKKSLIIRWSFYNFLLWWIVFFAELGGQEFIYFQF